jgi:hypothetical protein
VRSLKASAGEVAEEHEKIIAMEVRRYKEDRNDQINDRQTHVVNP